MMVRLTEIIKQNYDNILKGEFNRLYLYVEKNGFDLDLKNYIESQKILSEILKERLIEFNIELNESYIKYGGELKREETYEKLRELARMAIRSELLSKESLFSLVIMD